MVSKSLLAHTLRAATDLKCLYKSLILERVLIGEKHLVKKGVYLTKSRFVPQRNNVLCNTNLPPIRESLGKEAETTLIE